MEDKRGKGGIAEAKCCCCKALFRLSLIRLVIEVKVMMSMLYLGPLVPFYCPHRMNIPPPPRQIFAEEGVVWCPLSAM